VQGQESSARRRDPLRCQSNTPKEADWGWAIELGLEFYLFSRGAVEDERFAGNASDGLRRVGWKRVGEESALAREVTSCWNFNLAGPKRAESAPVSLRASVSPLARRFTMSSACVRASSMLVNFRRTRLAP
jgi:hypothetical protein